MRKRFKRLGDWVAAGDGEAISVNGSEDDAIRKILGLPKLKHHGSIPI